VTDGPNMNHHDTDPWLPCRRHLYETYEAILPRFRDRARWRVSTVIWERLKKDHDLACEWTDGYRSGARRYSRTLLGMPVDLIPDGGPTVQLILNTECQPARTA
jgi:hypothetical protein